MNKKIHSLYKRLYSQHGSTAPAVKARSSNQQNLRFKYLFECANVNSHDSILDIGSGLGDLLNFKKKKRLKCNYTGIDFLNEFIEVAKNKYKKDKNSKFVKLNILKQKIPYKYDWVMLSGMFNDKYKNSEKDMTKVLNKMFDACKKGIIFNSLTKYVDYEDKKLFYSYPDKIFKHCVENFSNYVVLKTDYQLKKGTIPFEYTMCVKKNVKKIKNKK